jgi:hypothetical protein
MRHIEQKGLMIDCPRDRLMAMAIDGSRRGERKLNKRRKKRKEGGTKRRKKGEKGGVHLGLWPAGLWRRTLENSSFPGNKAKNIFFVLFG